MTKTTKQNFILLAIAGIIGAVIIVSANDFVNGTGATGFGLFGMLMGSVALAGVLGGLFARLWDN